MRNYYFFIFPLICSCLFSASICFSQETISFSTYYSVPEAVYRKIAVNERIQFALIAQSSSGQEGAFSYSPDDDSLVAWDKSDNLWETMVFKTDVAKALQEVSIQFQEETAGDGDWSDGVFVPAIEGENCNEACARFNTTCKDADAVDVFGGITHYDKSINCNTPSLVNSDPVYKFYNRCLCEYTE